MSTDWNLHLILIEGPSLESFSFEEPDSGVTWYHFSINERELTVPTGILTFPEERETKKNQNHGIKNTLQGKKPESEDGHLGKRITNNFRLALLTSKKNISISQTSEKVPREISHFSHLTHSAIRTHDLKPTSAHFYKL